MNKTFFVFSKEHIHFLESIDTGSLFSLGTKELELLKSKDEKVIEFLFDKKIIKKEETSDNLFSAVFLVNDFCNLQCSYCFENGSEKNHSKMKETTIDRISGLLKQHNDITFSGGEPLLCFEVIKNVCDLVDRKNLKADYSLVTNGLLIDDEVIEYLDNRCFHVQVSLDGVPAENNRKNDRTNIHIENRILKNMIHAVEISKYITFTLRVNFNKTGIQAFQKKMDLVLKEIANYHDRISVDMRVVDLPVGSEGYVSITEKYQAYEKFYWYLLKRGISLPTSFVNGGFCMARNSRILLLDSNGVRYPCFSFAGNPDFVIKENEDAFFQGMDHCSDICELYDLCMGGCLYENYCETGTMHKQCDYEMLFHLNKTLFTYKLVELVYISAVEGGGYRTCSDIFY